MRIKLNASYIFNFQQFPEHYPRNNAAKLNKNWNNTTLQGKMLRCKSRIYLDNSYKIICFSNRREELDRMNLCILPFCLCEESVTSLLFNDSPPPQTAVTWVILIFQDLLDSLLII